MPNFDDIPDMDDEDAAGGLVEEDDDAAVAVEPTKQSGAYVSCCFPLRVLFEPPFLSADPTTLSKFAPTTA
jgi:hypothetical protein